MRYRAWARAGTALLFAATPHFLAHAQPVTATNSPTAPAAATTSIVPVLNSAAQLALQKAISSSQRIEPSRDRWRNPAATLQFFGVRPTDTVIEVWPGQGWYTSILGPYLKQGSGSLVVGHFDASSTNSSVVRQIVDAYRSRFASDQGSYGLVNVVPFGPRSGPLGMPGSADSVLTFRNIHNWMAQGWAEKAFGDFFLVLKPGGILGIEEHRGRTDEPQDPLARDGYVREDFVIQLAREAGFEFIGRSEINANPADTKDHPFGVWTLPPVSRTSPLGQRDDPGFDRTRYDAIGESDRMTLRFRKPINSTGTPPAPGTRWSPVIVTPAPPPPAVSIVQRATPPTVRPPVIAPPVVSVPSASRLPVVAPTTTVAPPRSNGEAAAPRSIDPVILPPRSKAVIQPVTPSMPTTIVPAPIVPVLPPSPPSPVVSVVSPVNPTVPPPVVIPAIVDSKPLAPLTVPATTSPTMPPSSAPQVTVPGVLLPPPSPPLVTAPTVAPPASSATRSTPPIPAAVLRPTRSRAAASRPAVSPPPSTTTRPPVGLRAQPARQTTPPATVTPSKREPARVGPARVARPAIDSNARQPAPSAPKAKAKAAPSARPVTRTPPPAPIPKRKAAPVPLPDPNKPDWVVPRKRS